MPIGYLITTLGVAFCTLLAVVPLRRPGLLASLSFRGGLLPGELPFLVFIYLTASTLLVLVQGGGESPAGWTAFGLACVSAVGLILVIWRGVRSRQSVEQALDAGIGVGWRVNLQRRKPPAARIVLAPFFVRRGDVERISNLPYGNAGERNLLDIYRHRSRPVGCPTLLHLHGGHFTSGRKSREARPLLYELASQGWICASANYRLSPAATFPDNLVDVKQAIAWLRDEGRSYGVDPTMMFVAGSSAGAHLAAMAALTPNNPTFQPGFEEAETTVAAAICLHGYYGPLTGDLASSPLGHVTPDAPPFFIAHGDQDTIVPVQTARLFADRLRSSSSNPVVYAELPGAQHSFDLFDSLRFANLITAIEDFAPWVEPRRTHPAQMRVRGIDPLDLE